MIEDILSDPVEGVGRRVNWKACGLSDDDIGRPIIGIASSWNELVPGHFNLDRIADYVKRGIYRGGCTAVTFGVPAACDGIAQGHEGMKYILPSREVIADAVEIMAQAHKLAGLVLLGSCDKIVPAMLMAAARLDIPCIFLPAGPMLRGTAELDGKRLDKTQATEAAASFKNGRITEEAFSSLEDKICGSCGSCTFYGTANTMCGIAEAMGMCLPNGAMTPAADPQRLMLATATGVAITELVKKKIGARDIITREALENAMTFCTATSGSTNAFMHLAAIAREAEIDMDVMAEFDRINRNTPVIARVYPSCDSSMSDLHNAGGVPRILWNLREYLHLDALTVSGRRLGEEAREYGTRITKETDCITTPDQPYLARGGLQVLYGNLAPLSAVTKPGAIAPEARHFTGKARCFDCEEDANRAILNGEIQAGTVVVIRYEGPKGGPGMREMFRAMKYIKGLGLAKEVAVVTDGRFSGTNNGCFVGHVSPEAARGGPIAIVRDGDEIEIDTLGGRLELHVAEEEIAARLAAWREPAPRYTRGYLARYAREVSSAAEGAVLG
ncbi:MAG: dihydroxy-acid dehydratase [Firmicutes bacterium]|nr:dihydroxy-acid dehydratase [Bacillota bacterium]